MDRFELMVSENDISKIVKTDTGYIGIIYNPETGQEVERVYSDTEKGIRAKIVRFTYTTLPIGSTR